MAHVFDSLGNNQIRILGGADLAAVDPMLVLLMEVWRDLNTEQKQELLNEAEQIPE